MSSEVDTWLGLSSSVNPRRCSNGLPRLQGITHQLQWGQSTEKRTVLLKLLCNGEAQLRITLNSEQDSNNLYLAWRSERLRAFVAYH